MISGFSAMIEVYEDKGGSGQGDDDGVEGEEFRSGSGQLQSRGVKRAEGGCAWA